MRKFITTVLSAALLFQISGAQQTLSVEKCREMALSNNKTLEEERIKSEMAGYDRKIAASNYFPNVSVSAACLHNGDNISLVTGEQSATLQNMGTVMQQSVSGKMSELMQAVMSNPNAVQEYMKSPMWQTVLAGLTSADISTLVNGLGTQLDEALHLDVSNVTVGLITVQQPLFTGGKILASNQIAKLALELAQSRYDDCRNQAIVEVDSDYWQIVSIAAKKRLAQTYCDLLEKMLSDALTAIQYGVATQADALSIKVKANEAAMLLTRSTNGLALAKMLLCKQIGLPLDSDITLEDETDGNVGAPQMIPRKSIDDICAARPDIHQIELAGKIYDKKAEVVRADMLPTVALSANYIYSNPNVINGFQKEWGGTWNAGVVVTVPIFHGTQALQKTRKAKAEAELYRVKYEDAKNLVNLQVNQLRCQMDEAQKRLAMAQSNIDNAEENLRCAMVGFQEGVVPANTTLAAQTAWLQANSEYVDAMIGVQMTAVNINKAEGNIK